MTKERIHFIAIGGSAMHNLAIALKKKGYNVSGSDDQIFEPSKSRLAKHNLLPKNEGWDVEMIDLSIDKIILGMHAKKDNPELLKAIELGIPIYSYPEFIYEESKLKKRVVIGGSHGKTSITSMILHVLSDLNYDFDYLVGAQLEGFDTMVQLSDAPIIIIEGDEYLSSPIDRRPKFLWYKPDIAVLSGIAWDHINVFPTFEEYIMQFELFVNSIKQGGFLTYYHGDENLKNIAAKNGKINLKPYTNPIHKIEDGKTFVSSISGWVELNIFGQHNLQNLMAALNVCSELGIDEVDFYKSIVSFKGAAKRLEKIAESERLIVYKDFAHSPSKLKATTKAVKNQYPDKKLIACMELHTFSSLNKAFLSEYKGAMQAADEALVYFNPNTIKHKGLDALSVNEVKDAFLPGNITVFDDSTALLDLLSKKDYSNDILLLMTSGNFDGVELNTFAEFLAKS